MSVELHEDGKILMIKLTGKLTKDDYEHFIPEVERLVKQHGKLRMLVQMHDFHGWTAGALWQDIKFDLKHFRDIERLALVGEKRVGARHGGVLQAFYHRHDPVLRPQ